LLENVEFVYDGIPSSKMALMNVNRGGDLYEEPFVAEREIIEEKIPGRDKPYFQGIERSPLSFPLRFAVNKDYLEDSYLDDVDLNAIARWLTPDYYKPLYFTDEPDKIYYCMPVQDFSYVHNGLKEGYVELTMRCADSYVYSPPIISSVYDYSNNPSSGTELIISNEGDVTIKPTIYIIKIGDGDISIVNKTNGNQELKFTGLADNENLMIDCENEDIVTNLVDVYRYENHNDVFLELVRGENYLQIYGNCKLQWKYELRFLR
jgi:phage-related protein